ncbi:MAG: 1-(5-phosphoribosyl)-5-[(5-phosphoribosylamino)methylideneamino] imidazole-4-carboxamide isomerase [Chromatiales bacterium USCg_Taylor]|nr:MAG: 1-(5-phosphoribosyl)-5-[(5-phosphoribosylamino)methylideneamino] imidazole-4-carboxamide isomerase [Chromatiales bacterium USCg_Taylor]
MLLIPAIDLKDGKCVRLRQGRMDQDTLYSEDPLAMARHWVGAGARRLHVVDLNGALVGKPVNAAVIRAICQSLPDVPVQVGGGIRDEDTIQSYLDAGVRYVIIGTKAVTTPHFVSDMCIEFPGHVMVGLDVRDGKLALEGWSKLSHHTAADLAQRFEQEGVTAIVYTDISRDGMMNGVNVQATVALAREITVPVIAAGGIRNLEDIRGLCDVAHEGIEGAITGRAIYEGSLDFKQAQRLADGARIADDGAC